MDGFLVITPEAQIGGPIAIIKNNDIITIDAQKNTIDLQLNENEIKDRLKQWKAPKLKVNKGTLYKYAKNVSTASLGCVTDL